MNKQKLFLKSVIASLAVLTCMGYAGCVDEERGFSTETTEKSTEFDFSTKKVVDINLKYGIPAGYYVQFEMYTKSPLTLDANKSYVKDNTMVPFLKGRCDDKGAVSFKGDLPASVSEIYVYSFGIGVPTLMKASVSPEGAVSEFKVAEVKAAASTRAASGTTYWKTYNVTLNKPTLPAVSMTITEDDKLLIDRSFPKDQVYDVANTYYQPYLELKKDAKVKIYSVSHAANSDRTNALAYYVYQGANVLPENVNSNLQLAFPELTKAIPAEGKGVQLLNDGKDIFKEGSRIGFALFPDITPGDIKTTNANLLYSSFGTGSWNTYSFSNLNRASAPHMVMSVLRKDDDGHAIIAISFEDQPWAASSGTNRGDFRDDIFILEVDPATGLDPDLPIPPPEEPTCPMEFSESGILCFEDCWPNKGDYDLNDLVIAYKRVYKYDEKIALTQMEETYTFLNNGAKYNNGFGYQLMGITQGNAVKSCTVTSDYKFEGQGLDLLSEGANVMLFDNAKNVKVGTTFNVLTTFNTALVTEVNPYLVTAGDYSGEVNYLKEGRIEVHLPSTVLTKKPYVPTSKANMTFFGTQDDKSVPAQKIYYVREGNYPFALNLAWDVSKDGDLSKFMIPTEEKSIEKTYPKFTDWVKSNGKENTDWYYHPSK